MVRSNWNDGDAYDRFMGRWSARIAPQFIAFMRVPPGRRWADIGCGTGRLSEAILEGAEPSEVIGVEPSAGFRAAASARLGDRARVLEGDAQRIPLADASVDAAVAGLVLNFVPDPLASVGELARVAAGGAIGAYLWDYADGMRVTREFWDAAARFEPAVAVLEDFALCRPDALTALFAEATGRTPELGALDGVAEFADFEDYWQPLLGGQGTAPTYLVGRPPAEQQGIREILRERLRPDDDGRIRLGMRAWAVRVDLG